MPNPADKDNQKKSSAMDRKLTLLEIKRNELFASLQELYDLSLSYGNDDFNSEQFLAWTQTIDDLRIDFRTVVEEHNRLLLDLDPTAIPSYQPIISFERLYSCVKRTIDKLNTLKVSDVCATGRASDFVSRVQRPSLPPIELMHFDGDIKNWHLFYASFKSTVHDNNTLNNSEKLYYLLGKLSPKAQSVFSGITPTADNYVIILESLINKYEDKRMLASSYLEQILNVKLTGSSSSNYEIFLDKIVSAANALKNLNIENLGDFILFYLSLKKLDDSTIQSFEMENRNTLIPTFNNLVDYVRSRYKICQNTKSLSNNKINNCNTKPQRNNYNKFVPNPQAYVACHNTHTPCMCANITHENLFKCPAFMQLSPSDRFRHTKDKGACVNCLSLHHKTNNCKSQSKCRICNYKHHTLIHFKNNNFQVQPLAQSAPAVESINVIRHNSERDKISAQTPEVSLCTTSVKASLSPVPKNSAKTYNGSTVLLATAQVVVFDSVGKQVLIRALVDSASQSNFITADLYKCLGLQPDFNKNNSVIVQGIGGSQKSIKCHVNLKFYSRFNSHFNYDISAMVVDRITDNLPTAPVDISKLHYLRTLPLADNDFATPGPIQMLIGAEIFPHLIIPGVVSSPIYNTPPAIETTLGFLLMGTVPTLKTANNSRFTTSCCAVTQDNIDTLLTRFWELEEINTQPLANKEENECEEHFRATTSRDESGRYTVALPFSGDPYTLGDSYKLALKRFYCLERKLQYSPSLRNAYDDVIRNYLDTGYLSPTSYEIDDYRQPNFYLSHHAIINPEKSTKVRIVFDAGCKTANGPSLNDLLHQGPNLQGNLFEIILRFRLFAVALSADCRQMFLQIGITPSDRRFLRILYRFKPQEPIQVYHFNRVTFGLRSSPYHALRVVKQLFEDEGDKYKYIESVKSSLYMDDVNVSVMYEPHAIETAKELISLFKSAQFDLVKWTSNSQTVLKNIPASHRVTADIEFDRTVPHKILGLRWDKIDDCFFFNISKPDSTCTKRSILSTVARLWDIMGYVAPTVLFAKLLIKELWVLKCDWDDTPPQHIITSWKRFCSQLSELNNIRIPRHLGIIEGAEILLVGFADASESAYGAVVYAHVSHGSSVTHVNILCAKSKVAPNKPLSIARLELCAAVLLSKLLRTVHNSISSQYKITDMFAFTDSRVVLCWINSPANRWQTFVANRVITLTDNVPATRFHHVAGIENPADCLSRGLTPEKLINHRLWFHGPTWLIRFPSEWPIHQFSGDDLIESVPEQRSTACHITTCDKPAEPLIYKLASKISSYSKLLRIIVYIYRFLRKLPKDRNINRRDLDFAENKLLLSLQLLHFANEIAKIINNQTCVNSLLKLNPFLDEEGLIRVGGRLKNANAETCDFKHPILLPRHDPIVDLIIDTYHKKYLHAGPELLMSLLRQRYWIISARRAIRTRIFKCNVCFKSKPRPTFPLMADLPFQRVSQVPKAFTHTGSDFAGPLQCTPYRARGVRAHKVWLCIFTCLTTRATHIEMAMDLSTPCFLNAFKRFIARRGPVQCMYSDRGTNFMGTRSYLRDFYNFFDKYKSQFEIELLENRIEWKNVPPAAPHFAGCMESMVKVVKNHLFKVIGDQILTYEELLTVLTQVEALLNSRPLTVLSSDPREPTAITPSHFLHTVPLSSVPVPEIKSITLHQRYLLVDKIIQSFWKRWRTEYLHQLQTRAKWHKTTEPIQVGTVVIIVTENIPSFSWPLGVIEKIHPSRDGIARVATVRTSKGTYVRPTVRLCPLPTQ